MNSAATMVRSAPDTSIHVGAPGHAVAIEAAALLNASLGEGFVVASDLTRLTGDGGLLVRARGKRGKLQGVATARILTPALSDVLQDKLRPAGSDASLTGHRIGELKSSAVAPAARCRGIGTQMLRARLAFLQGHGCRFAVVASWFSADAGHSSLGMLERAGFMQLATIPGYWADEQSAAGYACPDCGGRCRCTAIIMVLDLWNSTRRHPSGRVLRM